MRHVAPLSKALCDLGGIEMTNTKGEMSPRGTAIARYKARTNAEGASAWAEVSCAPSIRMHIPKFEITAVGAEEIDSKVSD